MSRFFRATTAISGLECEHTFQVAVSPHGTKYRNREFPHKPNLFSCPVCLYAQTMTHTCMIICTQTAIPSFTNFCCSSSFYIVQSCRFIIGQTRWRTCYSIWRIIFSECWLCACETVDDRIPDGFLVHCVSLVSLVSVRNRCTITNFFSKKLFCTRYFAQLLWRLMERSIVVFNCPRLMSDV